MGRVRKSSRLSKKGKINTTAYGKKNRKKYSKGGYAVKMSSIRERWNRGMTLKNNLRNLGLVYDINSDIKPFGKRKRKGQKDEMEFMEISEATALNKPDDMEATPIPPQTSKKLRGSKARTLHEEFQKRSDRPVRKTCHISTMEAEYLTALIQSHGTNYSAMYRDKLNYNQLTETQLRKKCEELLKSRETRHLNKFRELGLIT